MPSDSEISNDSDYDPLDETFTERLYALRDIIPPTTRAWFTGHFNTAKSYLGTTLFFLGRTGWTLCASALLVGVPFALCFAEEQQMLAMEQEQRMREMGNDLLGAPGENAQGSTAERTAAAL